MYFNLLTPFLPTLYKIYYILPATHILYVEGAKLETYISVGHVCLLPSPCVVLFVLLG